MKTKKFLENQIKDVVELINENVKNGNNLIEFPKNENEKTAFLTLLTNGWFDTNKEIIKVLEKCGYFELPEFTMKNNQIYIL